MNFSRDSRSDRTLAKLESARAHSVVSMLAQSTDHFHAVNLTLHAIPEVTEPSPNGECQGTLSCVHACSVDRPFSRCEFYIPCDARNDRTLPKLGSARAYSVVSMLAQSLDHGAPDSEQGCAKHVFV